MSSTTQIQSQGRVTPYPNLYEPPEESVSSLDRRVVTSAKRYIAAGVFFGIAGAAYTFKAALLTTSGMTLGMALGGIMLTAGAVILLIGTHRYYTRPNNELARLEAPKLACPLTYRNPLSLLSDRYDCRALDITRLVSYLNENPKEFIHFMEKTVRESNRSYVIPNTLKNRAFLAVNSNTRLTYLMHAFRECAAKLDKAENKNDTNEISALEGKLRDLMQLRIKERVRQREEILPLMNQVQAALRKNIRYDCKALDITRLVTYLNKNPKEIIFFMEKTVRECNGSYAISNILENKVFLAVNENTRLTYLTDAIRKCNAELDKAKTKNEISALEVQRKKLDEQRLIIIDSQNEKIVSLIDQAKKALQNDCIEDYEECEKTVKRVLKTLYKDHFAALSNMFVGFNKPTKEGYAFSAFTGDQKLYNLLTEHDEDCSIRTGEICYFFNQLGNFSCAEVLRLSHTLDVDPAFLPTFITDEGDEADAFNGVL